MKLGFYPKLAWDGIRKNKRLYLPYILTCIGMVMMHYIVSFLATSPGVHNMPGSATICMILQFGSQVIAFFALLFLFYSNSFLMRRRKKEFGLYNMLGMNKRNIGRILLWEVLIVALLALAFGLGLGIALSKLFELMMINFLNGDITYSFTVDIGCASQSALIFGGIFLLLFLNGLRQISLSKPVELLRSENSGEKAPKANWFLAVLGVVVLAAAYYLAVTIDDPITVLTVFFVAVMLVIAATYLLFVSGSVMLCRVLQRKKSYYYKPNHFVSVSSMVYRMKRNGAGLASICILLTMVLVMLSSTAALFIGTEDSLNTRYPKDFNVDIRGETMESIQEQNVIPVLDEMQRVLDAHGAQAAGGYHYRAVATAGFVRDGILYNEKSSVVYLNGGSQSDIASVFFVPLEAYNTIMGENQELEEDEVLIFPFRTEYTASTFQIVEGKEYRVKGLVDSFVYNGEAAMTVFPSIFVFVPDLEQTIASASDVADFSGDNVWNYHWYCAFDLNLSDEEIVEIYHEMQSSPILEPVKIECRQVERADFYGLYGGLFFLGIMLSLVFLTAAVLIIYYKQVSEGYEDQARYEVMQKVGMTKREIRKSVNSQMLTVFFLPLVTAGIHLGFAFPMIHKMLLIFNLWNTKLLICTTAVCFLIFGLFYGLVYRITSNAYFAIVSGRREERG